jgi:L-fucose mutarotase/ribose pyranase (RbsD/FucU family)
MTASMPQNAMMVGAARGKAHSPICRPLRAFEIFALAVVALPLAAQSGSDSGWRSILAARLPQFGHRNWIVVADSAYPAQSAQGIETVVSNADHFDVLRTVLRHLDNSKHVRPIVHLDRELQFVEDSDASGISSYREQLMALLDDRPIRRELHEQIIADLAQASQNFHVLIIKTNLTLPYTSVFLQLDCAYWSEDAERRLRQSLSSHAPGR